MTEFYRYTFTDMPFDVSAFDQLIDAVRHRPNFPHEAKSARDVYQYLLENPIKVFVCGSFHRGYNLIDAVTGFSSAEVAMMMARSAEDFQRLKDFKPRRFLPFLQLVGVATDDPNQGYISRDKRIWQYPEALERASLVPDQVAHLNNNGHEIKMTTERVKTDSFNDFVKQTEAEMALMGTFGQLIDQQRIDLFKAGFFNFHPVGNIQWPHIKDAGPTPFEAMIERGEPRCWMVMHKVNTAFDEGEIVGLSSFVKVPEDATPVDMHERSSPLVKEALSGFFANFFQRFEMTLNHDLKAQSDLQPGVYASLTP